MMTLTSGSAGLSTQLSTTGQDDFVSLPKLSMFKDSSIYPTMLRSSQGITGVILPAFDDDVSKHDSAYKLSVAPYRNLAGDRGKDGRPPFNGWFVPLGTHPEGSKFTVGGVYKYFGRSKCTFISPISIGLADPIVDLAIWIRTQNKKHGDSRYMHLVTKAKFDPANPKSTPPTPLPSPSMAVLVNAVCTGSNPHDEDKDKLKNRVLLMTETTFNELTADLNKYIPGGMAPIDPDNPRYLLGDITKPSAALVFRSEEAHNSSITYTYLNFGSIKEVGNDSLVFEGSTLEVTEEQLANRFDLTDLDNVINIPTYDEIVMQLLVEGLVPREVMIEAGIDKKCGHFPSEEEVSNYIKEYNNNNSKFKAQDESVQLQFGSTTQSSVARPMASPAKPVQTATTVAQPQKPVWVAPTPVMDKVTNESFTPPQENKTLSGDDAEILEALKKKAATDPTSMTTEDFNTLASLMKKIK